VPDSSRHTVAEGSDTSGAGGAAVLSSTIVSCTANRAIPLEPGEWTRFVSIPPS
jgi:hypothetical protein